MPLLEPETCYRAVTSRDPRFDGRFFTAVRTTGIYCRPICPARTPRLENVSFYLTAAGAEEAGFRACRRCRPDSAPGSPEWRGSSWKLTRALRAIHAGALTEGGVEELASQLELSSRHLARLFQDELGCSPIAVAQTVRAHFARRLLDDTALPMTQVALAAGYGSVRRFNTAMRERFHATPSELRGERRRAGKDQVLRMHLAYRPPYAWYLVLGFLGARAIPGVELIEQGVYRRTLRWEGHDAWLAVQPVTDGDALQLSTNLPAPRGLERVVERTRDLFDLRADPARLAEDLGADPALARALAQLPGIRVPGAWDGFEVAVRAVLGQQVTVRGAATLLGRLCARYGAAVETGVVGLERVFPQAEDLVDVKARDLGVPEQRARALRELSRAVAAGDLDLDTSADPEETGRRLMALPGIGPWTASYVAMRALRDPDAFPQGDLVLRQRASTNGEPISARALLERAEAWRPWRAYAAMLLWNGPNQED